MKVVPIDEEIAVLATEHLRSKGGGALLRTSESFLGGPGAGSGGARTAVKFAASFPPGQGGLSPAQVAELVGAFDLAKMPQGRLGGEPNKGPVDDSIRRGHIQWISADEVGERIFSHLFTLAVVANREREWNFDLGGPGPSLQGTRYDAGRQEHYSWHMDWGSGLNRRRKIAVVAHLSEPSSFEGGSLQIANGSVPFSAVQTSGAATVFPSFIMHQVTPVTKGTRLGVVSWILGPTLR